MVRFRVWTGGKDLHLPDRTQFQTGHPLDFGGYQRRSRMSYGASTRKAIPLTTDQTRTSPVMAMQIMLKKL